MIKEILKLLSQKPETSGEDLKALEQKLALIEAAEAARAKAEEAMGARYDRHLRTVSLILTVAGLVVAVAGILMTYLTRTAQIDSRETAREMRAEVRDAVSQMNSNFARLAGDALKQPKLEILHDGVPLDGLKFETNRFPISLSVSIRNTGQKKAEEIKIRIYSSELLTIDGWEPDQAPNEAFRYRYSPSLSLEDYLPRFIQVGDTVVLRSRLLIYGPVTETNILCRVRLLYGTEPSDANFTVFAR